ncbi:MAG: putative membrane protein YdjX (TVP38/TMEM64 family) [Paraglaciecola sp.]
MCVLLAAVLYFDLQVPLLKFFDWLKTIGFWAPLLFILIDMLLVICLLPGILFTLAAGFLFGPLIGTICVLVATTLGAVSAFLISRHLFNEGVKNYLRNHKKLKVVNDELVDEGWKFILLTRLMPFFPLKLSNYFFGATNYTTADFVMGTFLGIIPNTFFIVYLGSLAADLSMLASGELLRSPNAWGFYVFAFTFLLIMVAYVTKHAQRALLRYETRAVKDNRKKHAT